MKLQARSVLSVFHAIAASFAAVLHVNVPLLALVLLLVKVPACARKRPSDKSYCENAAPKRVVAHGLVSNDRNHSKGSRAKDCANNLCNLVKLGVKHFDVSVS